MHRGSIAAESAGAGSGSTFTLELTEADPPHGASTAEADVPAPEAIFLHVVIVDDNEDAAETLCHLLRSLGHE